MTAPFAARLFALLLGAPRRHPPGAAGTDPAPITLSTLNLARRTLPHPATPAYRLRQPVGRTTGRPAWPFRADAASGATVAIPPPTVTREHRR